MAVSVSSVYQTIYAESVSCAERTVSLPKTPSVLGNLTAGAPMNPSIPAPVLTPPSREASLSRSKRSWNKGQGHDLNPGLQVTPWPHLGRNRDQLMPLFGTYIAGGRLVRAIPFLVGNLATVGVCWGLPQGGGTVLTSCRVSSPQHCIQTPEVWSTCHTLGILILCWVTLDHSVLYGGGPS